MAFGWAPSGGFLSDGSHALTRLGTKQRLQQRPEASSKVLFGFVTPLN